MNVYNNKELTMKSILCFESISIVYMCMNMIFLNKFINTFFLSFIIDMFCMLII